METTCMNASIDVKGLQIYMIFFSHQLGDTEAYKKKNPKKTKGNGYSRLMSFDKR